MSLESLTKEIDQAFAQGANQRGLELLRELNSSKARSPSSLNWLAVIEEQIGDWHKAGLAHLACIEAAPHQASAYLYAGYWLQQSKRIDAAAASYSLAAEADPTLFALANPNTKPNSPFEQERWERLVAGNTLLRRILSDQHRQAMEAIKASHRMRESAWLLTHDRPIPNIQKGYQPQLFSIPDLPTKPYFPAESLPWAAQLESGFEEIKNEYLRAMEHKNQVRPYLDAGDPVPDNLSTLSGSLNWSALDLYRDGELSREVAEKFPVTLAAIHELPTYRLTEHPFEVFFSILKPKQSIAPHFGQSNHSLTVHLPIKVPGNGYLEVNNQKEAWQEGKILAFDDNYLHAAFNNSDATRIVLIFSIWHPGLTNAEREAVRAAFKARQQWMLSRREKLRELKSG